MCWFNTAGPNRLEYNYLLPAAARLPEAARIIAQQGYFVMHAPRQTGKTTTILALAKELTESGKFIAVMLSMQVGGAFRNEKAENAILDAWRGACRYQQHTTETGQKFTADALQHAFDLTQGQPWLVNALAKLCVEDLVPDLTQPVTADHIDQAKEILILRRDTHLDSLAERLREPRVRRIIEPILAGTLLNDILPDDLDFVLDLGLVRRIQGGGLAIANPIYKEVIPRELTVTAQNSMPHFQPSWLTANGQLDPQKLLDAFLTFWQPLLKTAHYHEIAPHIVLLAFLQRVVNGGGTIDREYAIGSRRMDLLVRYGDVRVALELKVWRDGSRDPLPDGLAQLDSYLNGLGLDTGWLVIFDQRSDQPPLEERTTAEEAITPAGRTITLIRA